MKTRIEICSKFEPIQIRIREFLSDGNTRSDCETSNALLNDKYGISEQKLFHLSLRGMQRQEILSIRSIFESFDEDNSGSLTPDEVQSSLGRYGLSVSPEEFESLMSTYDSDKNGSLGYEEIVDLFLSLKARASSNVSRADKDFEFCYFADAASAPDVVPSVVQIPRSSFDPQVLENAANVTLLLNLEFDCFPFIKIDQNQITLPVKVVEDQWIEKTYRYDSKVSMDNTITFHFQENYEISSNVRKNKCVMFPGNPKEDISQGLQGFPILSADRNFVQIGLQDANASRNLSQLADFPEAPAYLSTLQASAGTHISELGKVVADACLLPSWYPFTFSYRLTAKSGVKPSYRALITHLGEVDNAQDAIYVKVSIDMQRLPQALVDVFTRSHPWLEGISLLQPSTPHNNISPIHVPRLGKSDRTLGLRIIPRAMRTASRSALWLSCPAHVNVLSLVMPVGPCLFVVEYRESVSLRALRRSLRESDLSASQQRCCILMLAAQLASGLEHVHEHEMMHLDVKPDNVIIAIGNTLPDSLLDFCAKLCDFSSSMCTIGDNVCKRGTPGFWSPEQIHNPLSSSSTSPCCYWKADGCFDPPPLSDHALSQHSDSWGWSTTLLYAMGMLEDMKQVGYTQFQQRLHAQGYDVDLSSFILHDPLSALVLRRQRQAAEETNLRQKQAELAFLEDESAKMTERVELVWREATESLKVLDKNSLKRANVCQDKSRVVLIKEALQIILTGDVKLKQQEHTQPWSFTDEVRRELMAHSPIDSLQSSEALKKKLEKLDAMGEISQQDEQTASVLMAYTSYFRTLHEVHNLSSRIRDTDASAEELRSFINETLVRIQEEEQALALLEKDLNDEKAKVRDKTSTIMELVLTKERRDIGAYLQQLLRREYVMSEEAYRQLSAFTWYSTGEHALIMSKALPAFNSGASASWASPDHRALDADAANAKEFESLVADFPFLEGNQVPGETVSLETRLEASLTSFCSSNGLSGKLDGWRGDGGVRHAVGDVFLLLLLWCLQHNPTDRPPIRTVRSLVSQLIAFQGLHPPSPDPPPACHAMTTRICQQDPDSADMQSLRRLSLKRHAGDQANKSDLAGSLLALQELVACEESRDESEDKNLRICEALLRMSKLFSSIHDSASSQACLAPAIQFLDRLYAKATQAKGQAVSRRLQRLKFELHLAETASCLTSRSQESLDSRIQLALEKLCEQLQDGTLSKIEDARMLSDALAVAAALKEAQGRYPAALKLNEVALQASMFASCRFGYLLDAHAASLAGRIASLHTTMGNFAMADASLYRALSSYVLEQTPDCARSLVQTLLLAASSHKLRHDFSMAQQLLHAALSEVSQQLESMRGRLGALKGPETWSLRARVLHELGELADSMSDWNKSLTVYQRLLTFKSSLSGPSEEHGTALCAMCLVGMGDSLLGMQAAWKAVEKYQMAREMTNKEFSGDLIDLRASICERLGRAHVRLGNVGIALEFFSESSRARERLQGRAHPSRASCLVWMVRLRQVSLASYKQEAEFVLRAWSSSRCLATLESLQFLLEFALRIFAGAKDELSLHVGAHVKLVSMSAAAKSRREEAKRQLEERLDQLKSMRRLPAVEPQALEEANKSYHEACREEVEASAEERRLKRRIMQSRAALSKKEDEAEKIIDLYESAVRSMRERAPKAIKILREGEEVVRNMKLEIHKLQESVT